MAQKPHAGEVPAAHTRGGEAAAAAGGGERGGGKNVIDLVIHDHNVVKQLYSEYQSAKEGAVKEAKGLAIMREICMHSGREEITLYPEIRKKLDNGDQIVDRSIAEHQKVTEDLAALEALSYSKDPREFDRLVNTTMEDLIKHIQEEEGDVLPALRQKCTENELVELGNKWLATKVTTRPHPSAPREGMAAAAAHMASIPLDMAKDASRFDEKTRSLAEQKVPQEKHA